MKSRIIHLVAATVLLLGTPWQTQAAFTAVDNFNARTTGNLGGQGTWVASDTTTAFVLVDPGDAINKILRHSGSGDAAVSLPATVANSTTGTLFLRLKRVSASNDVSFGLNDTGTANPGTPGNFEMQGVIGGTALRGRDAGAAVATVPAVTLLDNKWYKLWMVADNTTDTWKYFIQSDEDATYATQTELVSATAPWGFRNGTAAALVAAQFYSNSTASSNYFDDIYIDNAAQNLADPTYIANPDADGDGMKDAWEVFYFGNAASRDGTGDFDSDGLTDMLEYTNRTFPNDTDTDDDGLTDGQELSGSANTAFGNAPTNPLLADTDSDGASDGGEVSGTLNTAFANAPTNPNSADTDADSFSDFDEFTYAANPNSSASFPKVYVLIGPNTRNGGFELLNGVAGSTVNYNLGWDAAGSDVDNWYQWSGGTVFTAGGSQYQFPAEGIRSGMFDNGVGAFNPTTHVAKAGEIIEVKWNHTQDTDLHTTYLVYGATGTKVTDLANPAGIPGTFKASAGAGTLNRFVYKVPVGSSLIGQPLGVAILGTSGAGSKVDNVYLTVNDGDSDADGLSDFWEDQFFGDNDGNPTTPELALQAGAGDPDSDGFTNAAEQAAGSNPSLAASTPDDMDVDGLADAWEIGYFGTITAQNGSGDPDYDFATNLQEYNSGVDSSNPSSASSWPDTDTDGLNDGWERTHFSNSLVQTGAGDPDGDGSSNLAEMTAGSDPNDTAWTPARAKLAHRWSFNNSLNDSVGTSHATLVDPDGNPTIGGIATLSANEVTLAGGASASSDYISLGTNLLAGKRAPVTIELWATQHSVMNQSRIFDFGNGTNEYIYMSWTDGTNFNSDGVAWKDPTQILIAGRTAPYTLGTKFHIVMTLEPAVATAGALGTGTRVSWYATPAGIGAPLWSARGGFNTPYHLVTMNDVNNWLGHSQWAGDSAANASYDEVRIWDGSLTEIERELFQVSGPDAISFADTDTDGLFDSWEIAYFGNLAQLAAGNPDGDIATNLEEQTAHSNPALSLSLSGDVDGDGLADTWETTNFGNLVQTGTGDPDLDFNTNEAEETAATNPLSAYSWPDADVDTLNDGWEVRYFGNLTAQGPTGDPDGDTFDNLAELTAGSDPTNGLSSADTDFDNLPDGWELNYFILVGENKLTDFATIIGRYTGGSDPDGDGATNRSEHAAGTHPMLNTSVPDTNGDGIPDGFVLTANDANSTTATSFNSAGNWDGLAAPATGFNYLVRGPLSMRSPEAAADFTFAGAKLVLAQVGVDRANFVWKNNGKLTIPYLGLDGAQVNQAAANGSTVVLDGLVQVTKASELWANNGSLTVAAAISGTGQLNLTGGNTVTFTGASTWTGNLNATAAFVLGNGTSGSLTFKPTANGLGNTITGTGAVTLNGSFNIDLAAASTTLGHSWTIVGSVGARTYGTAFAVTGFTPDAAAAGARKWTAANGAYQFDEATGKLTVIGSAGGFSSWISGYFANPADQAPGADPDQDGISNLMEYAIAGMVPNAPNGAPGTVVGKTVTFNKRPQAVVTYALEKSADLGLTDPWAGVAPTVDNDSIISYTFPGGGPAKDFIRLKVGQ